MLNTSELAKLHRLINTKENDRLAIVFNALSDPNRCKVFRTFVAHGDEVLCVTDVAQLLKVSPSAASQHLKILVITNLLERKRQGQKVTYAVKRDDPLVSALIKSVL